ncbi:MAG: hypothetical protein WDA71_07540 [Actinomycetota bacterium]
MDALIAILDSYDEDLLGAVDAEGHLVISVAERMRDVAGQLERGEIAPANLDEVWEWWSTLVMAFVEAYEIEDVQKLAAVAPMGSENAQFPTLADMRYLQALQLWLDAYIGERRSGSTAQDVEAAFVEVDIADVQAERFAGA